MLITNFKNRLNLNSAAFLFLALLAILNGVYTAKAADNSFDPINSQIEVNCCFSIGETCRSAYHIQKHGKRFQAAPLDWMRDYSLDTCLHLFRTNFSDFFEEIEQISFNQENRCIVDVKNNILCIHHFSSQKPLDQEHKRFREMMLRRAKRVNEILNKSESIALIYHQENIPSYEQEQKMISFIKDFSKIYPNKKIYLINVVYKDIPGMESEIVFKEENLQIIRFSFKDIREDLHFSGNHECWDIVMNFIKLVRNYYS